MIGSSWKRWDLHVHTPCSIYQNYGGDTPENWDKFILDLESLDTDIKVLGINDYLFIDGFKKVKQFKERGRLKNIETIFPVIELRISKFGNLSSNDPFSRINLHVIFEENTNPDIIKSQFLNAIQSKYQLDSDREGYWGGLITREGLIDFGQKIIDSSKVKPKQGPLKVGFYNLNFNDEEVLKILKESSFFPEYFVAVGKTEWDDLRWDGSAATKKDIINKADFVFTASETPENYSKAKSKLAQQGVNDLLIDCSDSHYYSTTSEKDRLGNCFTWIKADPTYEGLKQVLHERDHRLYTGLTKPVPPVHKIKSLKLSFPGDTMIVRADDRSLEDSSIFCLNDVKEIRFSPYFNCIIGGRGSGKSTILNLIAKKVGLESKFFEENRLRSNNRYISPSDFTVIEGTEDVEVISQNEVERYASSNELTEAIYDRLQGINGFDKLENLHEVNERRVKSINEEIERLFEIDEKSKKLESVKKSIIEYDKVISSFSSEEYKKLENTLTRLNSELNTSLTAESDYTFLIANLRRTIEERKFEYQSKNVYTDEIELVRNEVKKLIDRTVNKTQYLDARNKLEEKIKLAQAELETYLAGQGVNKEDIEDYDRAISNKPEANSEKEQLEKEIEFLKNQSVEFRKKLIDFRKINNDFKDAIRVVIQPMNNKLKGLNENVSDISFKYSFNRESAINKIFESFENTFSSKRDSSLRSKNESIKNYLFCVSPEDVDDYDSYINTLEKESETNAKKYLSIQFSEKVNFDIYKLIIQRELGDINLYKTITGLYGDKNLNRCSFGQRCTAVIVALMTFGNKPLIIDEPEAHLDSKLIAEYLVNLVKSNKSKRQLIFATHNANFVVNGDCEHINILNVGDDNLTRITETTIENLEHRSKLLSLEGGKDAFEKRDRRLIRR